MMDSIQIKNSGIRITVDGSLVKQNKSMSMQDRAQSSNDMNKIKTVQMRRNELDSSQRLKT